MSSIDTLPAAVQALRRLWKHYPSSEKLLQHMQHCWTTLSCLHQCLQAGMDCLELTVFPRMLLKQQQLDQWLPIWFRYIIRLHDGLIFCISGECRNAFDQKQKRLYKSHLPKSNSIYQAKYYSGTSWDEWNDAENGLLARYVHAISRTTTWWDTYVCEKFPILELYLNQVEYERQQLQQRFCEWQKHKLPAALRQATNIQLLFTDKMEQLKLTWQGKAYFWQRVQNKTCQQQSVVPLQWKRPCDWEQAFSYQPQHRRLKRIVLTDLNEHENENTSHDKTKKKKENPPAGYRVHVHQDESLSSPDKKNGNHHQTTSLVAMKQQYGIDASRLEESHAFVQAEERITRQEGQRIDQDPSILLIQQHNDDDQNDTAEETLEITKHQLQHSELMLKRLLLVNNNHDDDLLWNAREHVRQSAMEVGNQCLWYPLRSAAHLQLAGHMFQRAQQMVQAQTVDPTETPFYQRILHLGLGQAQANAGIVLTEQDKYSAAITKLQTAGATAQQLLELARQDHDLTHETQAWQLYSLTERWCGVALWHLNRREEAQLRWKEAAACVLRVDDNNKNEQYRELAVECITAWMVWADMCSQVLEHEVSSLRPLGDTMMYQTAQDVLQQAIALAQTVHAQVPFDDDTHHPATLQRAAVELEQWWKARQSAMQVTLVQPLTVRPDRSDVTLAPPPPTRRLLWKQHITPGTFDTTILSPNGTPQLPVLCGPPPIPPELAAEAQRLGIVMPL